MGDYAYYHKDTEENGVRLETEVVTAEYVENYTSRETLAFFESLGGTEKVTRHRSKAISVRSTSPDGKVDRITVFTPVQMKAAGRGIRV